MTFQFSDNSMKLSVTEERIFFLLLAFVVLTIPFSANLCARAIGSLGVYHIFLLFKYKYIHRNFIPFCCVNLSPLLIILLGLFNSSETRPVFKLIEAQFPLFVFPFMLVMSGNFWDKKALKYSLIIFACITVGCMLYIQGSLLIELFSQQKPLSDFFYWRNSNVALSLRIGMHPTYLSMYTIFSIAIFYEVLAEKKKIDISAILTLIGMLYLAIGTLHLSSKISIGVLALVCLIIVICAFRQFGLRVLWFVLPFSIAGVLLFSMSDFVVRSRFESSYISDLLRLFSVDSSSINPNDQRRLAWYASGQLIKDNFFFGVGSGDVITSLAAQYERMNATELVALRLDSHNQYMGAFLRNGVGGFLALLGLYFYGIYHTRYKNRLYLIFIIIIACTSLTENILERQKGAVLVGVFSSLLFQYYGGGLIGNTKEE